MGRRSSDLSTGSGYPGILHRDVAQASNETHLTEFIAAFKHALLFTPRLVLADHMVFSPNFEKAYRKDRGFRDLLGADLIDLAYFEKYANARAFTLVEHRKFLEYLRRRQDKRYDPRDPGCPSHPFDGELQAIESRTGRIMPEGSLRDPMFTAFATQELDNDTFKPVLGRLYGPYVTAFNEMRDDLATRNAPLGIIHFDAFHTPEGTNNIFDYMARISSLRDVPKAKLIDEFALKIAQAHRVLLIKAEMMLLEGAHAILPSDFEQFRTLALADPAGGTIEEREAELRLLNVDLSSVSIEVLASLSAAEIVELRKRAADFFGVLSTEICNPNSFDLVCATLQTYLQRVNRELGLKDVRSARRKPIRTYVEVIQGKVAKHAGLLRGGVGMMFKVVGALSHSFFAHHGMKDGTDSVIDVPLKGAEDFAKGMLSGAITELSTQDLASQIGVSLQGDRVMQYFNRSHP